MQPFSSENVIENKVCVLVMKAFVGDQSHGVELPVSNQLSLMEDTGLQHDRMLPRQSRVKQALEQLAVKEDRLLKQMMTECSNPQEQNDAVCGGMGKEHVLLEHSRHMLLHEPIRVGLVYFAGEPDGQRAARQMFDQFRFVFGNGHPAVDNAELVALKQLMNKKWGSDLDRWRDMIETRVVIELFSLSVISQSASQVSDSKHTCAMPLDKKCHLVFVFSERSKAVYDRKDCSIRLHNETDHNSVWINVDQETVWNKLINFLFPGVVSSVIGDAKNGAASVYLNIYSNQLASDKSDNARAQLLLSTPASKVFGRIASTLFAFLKQQETRDNNRTVFGPRIKSEQELEDEAFRYVSHLKNSGKLTNLSPELLMSRYLAVLRKRNEKAKRAASNHKSLTRRATEVALFMLALTAVGIAGYMGRHYIMHFLKEWNQSSWLNVNFQPTEREVLQLRSIAVQHGMNLESLVRAVQQKQDPQWSSKLAQWVTSGEFAQLKHTRHKKDQSLTPLLIQLIKNASASNRLDTVKWIGRYLSDPKSYQ